MEPELSENSYVSNLHQAQLTQQFERRLQEERDRIQAELVRQVESNLKIITKQIAKATNRKQ